MTIPAIRCVAITDSQGADNILCGPSFLKIAQDQYQQDGTDLVIYNKCQDGQTFQTAMTGTQYGGLSAVVNGMSLGPQCWIVGLGVADWLFNVAGRKGALAQADATALFAALRHFGGTVIFVRFEQVDRATAPDFHGFLDFCGAQADHVCTIPMYQLRAAGLLMAGRVEVALFRLRKRQRISRTVRR